MRTGNIEVYGSHLEIRSMSVGGWYAKAGANDVTFRNVRTSDLFIDSARNIRVIGGSVGPGVNYDSQIGGSPAPENILIQGVRFRLDANGRLSRGVPPVRLGSKRDDPEQPLRELRHA